MLTTLFFLSSGLFLGWSLGANDAANVFGTAVGSKMIRFKTAALICSIFVIIGAVVSGAGASHTLGTLGAVNALPGAFTVALAAAITVFLMTKAGLPVSTSQAIVGAIIGWNFFAGYETDWSIAGKISATWIICPILAMIFSIAGFFIARWILLNSNIHFFRISSHMRAGLLIVGAFGSYSLGANNIANVMGVFIPSSPFRDISLAGIGAISGVQELFLLGGIAIAVGVFTYSQKVMSTVGSNIFALSPITALIVTLASSMVLFIFASQELQNFFIYLGLPTIPLVPVSSSQAVVGAVIGIGIAKGGRNVNLNILGKISIGWVATPIVSALITYIALYFVQNVFLNQVYM